MGNKLIQRRRSKPAEHKIVLHILVLGARTGRKGERQQAREKSSEEKAREEVEENSLPFRPPGCHSCPHSCGGRPRSECPSCGWHLSPPSVSLHLLQGKNMDTTQHAIPH